MKWHRRRWCVTGDPVRTRGGGSPKIPNPIAAGHAAQSRDRSVRRRRQHPLGRLSESLCSAADTLWGLCELRDQMVSEALGRMAHNLTAAADTLVSLLGDEKPLVRLRAATALLEMVPKPRSDVDMAARVTDLERQSNDEQRIGA